MDANYILEQVRRIGTNQEDVAAYWFQQGVEHFAKEIHALNKYPPSHGAYPPRNQVEHDLIAEFLGAVSWIGCDEVMGR